MALQTLVVVPRVSKRQQQQQQQQQQQAPLPPPPPPSPSLPIKVVMMKEAWLWTMPVKEERAQMAALAAVAASAAGHLLSERAQERAQAIRQTPSVSQLRRNPLPPLPS
jgi:hypothetical protein